MMKYLQRQRKSAILSIGFKRLSGLLLGVAILLASVIPVHITDNLLPTSELTMGTEKLVSLEVCTRTGMETILSAPDRRSVDTQYTTRESYGVRSVEQIEQRTAFRYRYLQQIRLLVWYMIAGFFALPELYQACFGDGRRRQRELIPRSQMIVAYIKRADGKKNGIPSFIK